MKQCPKCGRLYSDDALNFCLEDGVVLKQAFDAEATHIPASNAAFQPTIISHGFDAAPPPVVQQIQQQKKGISLWFIVLPVIGIGLIVLVVAAILLAPKIREMTNEQREQSEKPNTNSSPVTVTTPSPTPRVSPTPLPTQTPPPPPTPQTNVQTGSVPGNYPQVSTRYLSEADLDNKGCSDLKIMRNEAFARHGYIFNTPEMSNYFRRQAWYRGQYEDVNNMISPVEKRNIELIKSNESQRGCK